MKALQIQMNASWNEKWQEAIIETLDTHDMSLIDSNVNFCLTFDTHYMSRNCYSD